MDNYFFDRQYDINICLPYFVFGNPTVYGKQGPQCPRSLATCCTLCQPTITTQTLKKIEFDRFFHPTSNKPISWNMTFNKQLMYKIAIGMISLEIYKRRCYDVNCKCKCNNSL